MVIPDQINDDEMVLLARDLSKQIEAQMEKLEKTQEQ